MGRRNRPTSRRSPGSIADLGALSTRPGRRLTRPFCSFHALDDRKDRVPTPRRRGRPEAVCRSDQGSRSFSCAGDTLRRRIRPFAAMIARTTRRPAATQPESKAARGRVLRERSESDDARASRLGAKWIRHSSRTRSRLSQNATCATNGSFFNSSERNRARGPGLRTTKVPAVPISRHRSGSALGEDARSKRPMSAHVDPA